MHPLCAAHPSPDSSVLSVQVWGQSAVGVAAARPVVLPLLLVLECQPKSRTLDPGALHAWGQDNYEGISPPESLSCSAHQEAMGAEHD